MPAVLKASCTFGAKGIPGFLGSESASPKSDNESTLCFSLEGCQPTTWGSSLAGDCGEAEFAIGTCNIEASAQGSPQNSEAGEVKECPCFSDQLLICFAPQVLWWILLGVILRQQRRHKNSNASPSVPALPSGAAASRLPWHQQRIRLAEILAIEEAWLCLVFSTPCFDGRLPLCFRGV